MLLAIVPAAPPTRKNQRATSCPAPISAKVPYLELSRLIWTAFWCVSGLLDGIWRPIRIARSRVASPRGRVVEGWATTDGDGADPGSPRCRRAAHITR